MGVILYVNSSLLGKFFSPDTVSLLFIIGALGNIILFLFTPKLIEQFGKRFLLLFFLFLSVVFTLTLGFTQSSSVALVSFIIYSSILFIIYYFLDIFLEEISENNNTGEVRGIYFTFVNLGIAMGPLILAILGGANAFRPVYLAASLLLVPPIFLALFNFKSDKPKWHGLHPKHMFLPLGLWWKNKNIRRVTIARIVLETFFALMIIYTPVYLHEIIGFDWSELGIIFAVMLLPFILFDWPVGELADHFFGEKEIMGIGFLITGISLLVMPFLDKSLFAWMLILFVSRIGASFIEIMTESYFFKKVDAKDTRLISIFRLTRPFSIIFAAVIGVVTLSLFSFSKIFIVLAVVVFLGLRESLLLEDTK